MRADLHFHSKYSDGLLWPDELVDLACKNGLDMLALTDHDTFAGVNDFLKAADEKNIIGIPAIEIDFVDNKYGFKTELLGYFPQGNFGNILEYISYFQTIRRELAEKSLEKARVDFSFPNLDVIELIEGKIGKNQPRFMYDKISLTKPDIFNYLNIKKVPHNYTDYQDFKREFFPDSDFSELLVKPEFIKCLELINRDGGYAVLAHPAYQFNKEVEKILHESYQYKENLKEARKMGLWGIEMHSYESVEEANSLNKLYHNFAIDCGLNITFGSDFHGKNSRQLGCPSGNFLGFKR